MRYRADADRLIQAALADTAAYNRLATMTDRFGNRLSGSDALEHTIDWVMDEMQPRRAAERARRAGDGAALGARRRIGRAARRPRAVPLHMIGLGMSVGTPPGGITARRDRGRERSTS